MISFVLDASVTVAWLLEDEVSAYADNVMGRLPTAQAAVPMLWPLEVANVLIVAERRGRISSQDSVRFTQLLIELALQHDRPEVGPSITKTVMLARDHRLSAYDAAYLELAMRLGCPLATLDAALRAAAEAAGVALLDPSA